MKATVWFLLAAICFAGLSGCGRTKYPSLSDLTDLGQGILSPEQQQQTISDLSKEQQNHGSQAVEEIEKR